MAFIRRVNIAPLIAKVLKRVTPDAIINGFRSSGLFSLNSDAVHYSRCLHIDVENGSEPSGSPIENAESKDNYKIALRIIEKELAELTDACKNETDINGNVLAKLYSKTKQNANIEKDFILPELSVIHNTFHTLDTEEPVEPRTISKVIVLDIGDDASVMPDINITETRDSSSETNKTTGEEVV